MYPKYTIELLIDEMKINPDLYSLLKEYLSRFREHNNNNYEEYNNYLFRELESLNHEIKQKFVIPLHLADKRLEIQDLPLIGASTLSLKKFTPYVAYMIMKDNNLPGIPIIDDNNKFLGIATKENIAQEIIFHLLENNKS